MVLIAGVLGGSLTRRFVREKNVTYVFVAHVIVESILLNQAPLPWYGLRAVLIPGNAIGFMVDTSIWRASLARKPQRRDVWVVNGEEAVRTDTAKAKSLCCANFMVFGCQEPVPGSAQLCSV